MNYNRWKIWMDDNEWKNGWKMNEKIVEN